MIESRYSIFKQMQRAGLYSEVAFYVDAEVAGLISDARKERSQ